MNEPRTIVDYGRRAEQVVAYIPDRPDALLGLETVAEVAALLPWHFHRI